MRTVRASWSLAVDFFSTPRTITFLPRTPTCVGGLSAKQRCRGVTRRPVTTDRRGEEGKRRAKKKKSRRHEMTTTSTEKTPSLGVQRCCPMRKRDASDPGTERPSRPTATRPLAWGRLTTAGRDPRTHTGRLTEQHKGGSPRTPRMHSLDIPLSSPSALPPGHTRLGRDGRLARRL